MGAYNDLTSLFLMLNLERPFDLPPDFLNQKFAVWSGEAAPGSKDPYYYIRLDGQKAYSSLSMSGQMCNTYGEFQTPINSPLAVPESPDTHLVMVGEVTPNGETLILRDRSFAEIALYCHENGLGIDVASNEVGYHFATNAFLSSALRSVYDVIKDDTKSKFLEGGIKVQLPEDAKVEVLAFANTFSPYLDSIDYAAVEIDGELELAFYLNFRDGSTPSEFSLMQTEFVSVLENLDLRCHVFCSNAEPQLRNGNITRITPESFEAAFTRDFGPG